MSNTNGISKVPLFTCKRWVLMLVLLLLSSGCSFHNGQISYFNMLDTEKQTSANKKAAEKFWSSVRPIETLSKSHYTLGRYYQEQGKHAKAIEEFTKALRNDKSYCKAHNGIAMSYDAMKQCDAAHRSYEQGLVCDSSAYYLYNNYACSSLLCGDYEQGLALLENARQLKESDERIVNNLHLAQSFIEMKKVTGKGNELNTAEPKRRTEPAFLSSPAPTAHKKIAILSQKLEIVHPDASKAEEPAQTINHQNQSLPKHNTSGLSKKESPAPIQNESSHRDSVVLSTTAKKRPDSFKQSIPYNLLESTIEVSNGNGVTGMAGRSAQYLREHGFQVGRLTNANHFGYSESIIFYRDGYLQVAQKLAQIIPGAQDIQKVDSFSRPSISVRLLLGKDLVSMHFPDDFYFKQLAHASR